MEINTRSIFIKVTKLDPAKKEALGRSTAGC